jgi:SAM-dependent methyltransferase
MRTVMTPQDYAAAFHLLSVSSRHPENIARAVREHVLPWLPERPSLLDVGAGPGKVAQLLAPHFASLTLLEPNRAQISGLSLKGAKVLHSTLEGYDSTEQHDLVVCSHVLYHVPVAEWGGFIDRLLARVRPGGYCMVSLSAARGQSYQLQRDFTPAMISSEQLIATLKGKGLAHQVIAAMNGFSTSSFEEMYTLCRFIVLENCFTEEQLVAMTGDEARQLEEKLRGHAERCRGTDGVYRLEQAEDLVLIPKQ